ncbi:MAG: hypothetical protein JXQ73_02825 [Phycisphaerae bacterium]|nr:hypothetical protein [Phycisphaerae bacterium]
MNRNRALVLLMLLPAGTAPAQTTQSRAAWSEITYANINEKSWNQILADNAFQWRPPYTVHLPIQPAHSPDFVHVDAALNVCRRRVLPNVVLHDRESYARARRQETFIVQFALDDPPFIPDFHCSRLALAEGKYPVVTADYFAYDLFYQIEYACCPVDDGQSLLSIRVSVTNEGEKKQPAHVRAKVNFQRECHLFDYHYVPFYWDVGKWLPCDKVSMKDGSIFREWRPIGKVSPGEFTLCWQDKQQSEDGQYNKRFGCSRPYFAAPNMRLKDVRDVIHAHADLEPGQTKTFSLALLTNFEDVTPPHREFLDRIDADECRQRALAHFKSRFSDKNTALVCPWPNWQDVFTELQTSTLQLLVRFPDETCLMPTQGGSSERFFVWVWEAVHMLRPMLRVGHFEPVRQALEFIFRLQDAGCPPQGNFITTAGSVGTTGPKWINSTGSALALAADYYLYSRDKDFLDEYLPKILRASDWIVGELRATRKLNPDGTRPLYYGLMPFGCGTDGDIGYIVSMSDAYTLWGLEKTVCLLERIKHERAPEFRRELNAYKADLARAIKGLTRPDGFIERKILTADQGTRITSKFENVSSSAKLAYTGAVDVHSDVFRRFVKYFEDSRADGLFMGRMDRDVVYIGTAEYIWQHVYLALGQWKKAFAATRTNLTYGMTQDTFQVQERFSKTNPAFTPWQPNGSGNGRMLDMMLSALYFEDDRAVTLLGAIPPPWLREASDVAINTLHTTNGLVSLRIHPIDDTHRAVVLSAAEPGAMPTSIRLPEHWRAESRSPELKDNRQGCFTVTGTPREVGFTISTVVDEP